jgi:hypothetical protein
MEDENSIRHFIIEPKQQANTDQIVYNVKFQLLTLEHRSL